MELWIRSQDKKCLTMVTHLYIDDNHHIRQQDDLILGTYETKRALEVLDEIQKLIKPTFKINCEYDDSQPIIDGEWLKSLKAESKIEELSTYVYEMPKEQLWKA